MEISGIQRRKKLVELMREANKPLSGAALGKSTGVSRQAVVQDIALLRTEGYPIVATPRGYMLEKGTDCVRLFKLCHTNEQTEEELTAIVDLGGCVVDVMVNHRAYGKISATLNVKSRRDVQVFMEQIRTGKSIPLLNVTSGYHFHHISAASEEILDEIEAVLRKKGFLTDFMPYELDTE